MGININYGAYRLMARPCTVDTKMSVRFWLSTLSIKLKALGPNRVILGRRGTVRFGCFGEIDGSMTQREKTSA